MKQVYYLDGQTMVCLLVDKNEVLARGISVCSRQDIFTYKTGKRQALSAASEAYGRKCNVRPIKVDAPRLFCDTLSISLARDRFGEYKGTYLPELTETERNVVLRGKL